MIGGNGGHWWRVVFALVGAALVAGCPTPPVEDPDGGDLLDASDAGNGDAGAVDGGVDAGPHVDAGTLTCHSCHGSELSDAPPRSLDGGVDRSLPGVGAHQAHLKDSTWHRPVVCADCHQVPTKIDEPGHLDGPPAEVSFTGPTQLPGPATSWDGNTCTVWCHDPRRGGGTLTKPQWTRSDVSQAYCGDCHGIPPPWPHPQDVGDDCSPCHADARPGLGFSDPSRHIDGKVDVAASCTACHGSIEDDMPAPPRDTHGNVSTETRGVGAHRSHLQESTWHNQIQCTECHQMPQTVTDPGHIDDPPPATMTWGDLAQAHGAKPEWTGTTCSNYCHGATIKGGTHKDPTWTAVDAGEAACGTCHSLPPQFPHPQGVGDDCSPCHSNAKPGLGFTDASRHIDGNVDVVRTCTSCHGSAADDTAAPPKDTSGNTSTTARGVGAHRSHLQASTWHNQIQCNDCHQVPQSLDSPGHVDDPPPATMTWSQQLAGAKGATPEWTGTTCSNYCHGATIGGGTLKTPTWTAVGAEQAKCGTCHSLPPPFPHPQGVGNDCSPCHSNAKPGLAFADATRHIDGNVDVVITCTSCHGSAADNTPAPPKDASGNTSTTVRGVGAHRSHLQASTWHNQIKCTDCHQVPQRLDDPGHVDDPPPATMTWSSLVKARGATPEWNGATCANYCHGATIPGGSLKSPTWTAVGAEEAKCGTCHSLPPTTPHPQTGKACGVCHPAVISVDGGFVDPTLHINGLVETDAPCGACHALPPATGAHLKHAGLAAPTYGGLETAAALTNPQGYAFGCGYCHPLDPSHHMNGGPVEVELYNPAGGGLKALTPATATYTAGGSTSVDDFGFPYTLGTCANVYCHSAATYKTPNGVPAPGVDFTFDGGYPIVYPSYPLTKGRAYATINWGGANPGCGGCHGLPPRTSAPDVVAMAGDTHSYIDAAGQESGHGFNHYKAPLPCRTCHFDTVSVANATSKDAGVSVYGPVPIAGFGWHVNGRPDVAFDKVDPIPSYKAGGPSFTLGTAAFVQATSTCTDVACHKQQTAVQHGTPFRRPNTYECTSCHPLGF